jgi:prepilin-type N-terminal cleavage/methylation domain-containing protein
MKRAFSLLELMVAMGLSAVVAAAATSATVGIYTSIVGMEQQTFAQEEANTLVDALATEILQLGGGDVRPWQALSNGCFLNSSGAVTSVGGATCSGVSGGSSIQFLDLNDGGGQCKISAATSTTLTNADSTCCITAANGFAAAGVNIVAIPSYPSTGPQSGGGWRAFRCVPLAAPACGCTITALSGGANLAPISGFAFPTAYTGGVLAIGEAVSWTFDKPNHVLNEVRDSNGDGVAETRMLSDRVFDINLAYGYDGQPEDGVLDFDTSGPTWQAAFDTRTSISTSPTNDPTAVRMVRLGVLTGSPVSRAANKVPSASLLGNPTITTPGFYLQQAQTAVTLRNMLVFY